MLLYGRKDEYSVNRYKYLRYAVVPNRFGLLHNLPIETALASLSGVFTSDGKWGCQVSKSVSWGLRDVISKISDWNNLLIYYGSRLYFPVIAT